MNTTIKLPSDFDRLSEEQREQLHEWLDEGLGYHKAMARLKDEFGFVITYNKLYRYNKRRLEKCQLTEHLEHETSMEEYIAILNGHPVAYDQVGIETIQKRAFELACSPKVTASTLATLLRVFHYKTARTDAERRFKQTDKRNEIAERAVKVKEEEHAARQAERAARADKANPGKRKRDALGPLIRNPQDIEKRADAKFGLTPPPATQPADPALAAGDAASATASNLQNVCQPTQPPTIN